jgi:plastocyanin
MPPGGSALPVVVWIEGPKADMTAVKKPAVMTQKSMRFTPGFLVVVQGQVVQFPNSDNVAHSVYSKSAAKTFDLGIFDEEERRSVIADRLGLIDVQCALHRDMNAKILVVPNVHFTTADASGAFFLKAVPAGEHRIFVWRHGAEPMMKKVVVGKTGVTEVAFGTGGR